MHCDGYHTTKEIAAKVTKLFDLDLKEARGKVERMIKHAESSGMIGVMPAFLPEDVEAAALLAADPADRVPVPAEDRILADPKLDRPMEASI